MANATTRPWLASAACPPPQPPADLLPRASVLRATAAPCLRSWPLPRPPRRRPRAPPARAPAVTKGEIERDPAAGPSSGRDQGERESVGRDRARKGAHDSTAPRATLARPTVTASADFEHCDCSSPHREQAEDKIPMSPPLTKDYPEQAKGEANGAGAAAAYLRAEYGLRWRPPRR